MDEFSKMNEEDQLESTFGTIMTKMKDHQEVMIRAQKDRFGIIEDKLNSVI